jgi:hypothetical protein
LNSTVSFSSLVVTGTSCSSLTTGSKCTSGLSGASSPYVNSVTRRKPTSSSFSSSFLGANEEPAPNPPVVVGAVDHALAVEDEKPPNRGLFVSPSDSLGAELGKLLVNEPKIFVALSEMVLAVLAAASLMASAVVAGSTVEGVTVDEALVFSSASFASFCLARSFTSSTMGASLLTPDIVEDWE